MITESFCPRGRADDILNPGIKASPVLDLPLCHRLGLHAAAFGCSGIAPTLSALIAYKVHRECKSLGVRSIIHNPPKATFHAVTDKASLRGYVCNIFLLG